MNVLATTREIARERSPQSFTIRHLPGIISVSDPYNQMLGEQSKCIRQGAATFATGVENVGMQISSEYIAFSFRTNHVWSQSARATDVILNGTFQL